MGGTRNLSLSVTIIKVVKKDVLGNRVVADECLLCHNIEQIIIPSPFHD